MKAPVGNSPGGENVEDAIVNNYSLYHHRIYDVSSYIFNIGSPCAFVLARVVPPKVFAIYILDLITDIM